MEANQILSPFNSIFTVMTFHFSCLLLFLTFASFLLHIILVSQVTIKLELDKDESFHEILRKPLVRSFVRPLSQSESVDKLNFRLEEFRLHDVAPAATQQYKFLLHFINLLYGYFGFLRRLMVLIYCND